jgi:hypothetical protein
VTNIPFGRKMFTIWRDFTKTVEGKGTALSREALYALLSTCDTFLKGYLW